MNNEKGKMKGQKILIAIAVIFMAVAIAVPCVAVASEDASADSGIVIQVKSNIIYDRDQVVVVEGDLGENDIAYTTTYSGARTVEFSTYSGGAWSTYSDVAPFAAGTYKVKVTVDGKFTEEQFIINKKELTLPNATAGTKPYDKSTDVKDFIGTGNLSGVCSGDTINMDKDGMIATVPSPNVGVQPVTMSGIVLTGVNSENYYLTYPTTLTINVQAVTLMVNVEGTVVDDRAYNGSANVHDQVHLGNLTGILPGDDVTIGSYTANMDDANVGVLKNVTIVVTLGGDDKGNYAIDVFYETITIYKAEPSMSTDPTAKTGLTYTGAEQVLINAGATNDGTIQYKLADGEYSNSLPKAKNYGTYQVYYKIIGDANHNDKTFSTAVSAGIGKAALTVGSITVAPKTYDGTTNCSISSITFTGLKNGETLTIGTDYTASASFANKNVGTQTVNGTATLLGSDKANNYSLADGSFTGTAPISKVSVELTLGNVSIGYDGTTKTKSVEVQTGIKSEKLTATYTAYSPNKGVYSYATSAGAGKYTVSWTDGTGGSLSNYTVSVKSGAGTFTIGGKEISIIGTTADPMVYSGDTNVKSSVHMGTLTGYAEGDDVKIDTWTATVANKNVGSGKEITFVVTLKGAQASNYTVAPITGVTIEITKAPLTISGATVTSRAYNGNTNGTVTAVSFTGLKNGETLALGTDFTATGTFTSKNAGTTTANVTVSLKTTEKANNYSIGTTPYAATSSITKKAVELTLSAQSITYDASTSTKAVQISTGVGSEKLTATYTAYSKNAGEYQYAASAAAGKYTVAWSDGTGDLDNYTVTVKSGAGKFTINKVNVSITGTSASSRAYNGDTNVKECITMGTLSGVLAADKSNVGINTTWTASVTNKDAGNSKSVSFSGLELTGSAAGNYNLTALTTVVIDITKAPLTISGATVTSRAYNGGISGTVTAVSFTGLQNGETLTLGTDFTATGAFASANAGTTAVNVTVSLKSTTVAKNYSIGTTPYAATSSITKKAVELTLGAQSITYDASTSTKAVQISTGVGSEKLTATYTAFSKNAGEYQYAESAAAGKYTVVWSDGTGGDLDNYTPTVKSGAGKFTIDKATITFPGTTISSMTYNGTTTVTSAVSLGTLTGVKSGDEGKVALGTWSATVGNKNVGTNKDVTLSIGITGDASGNYKVQVPTGLKIEITKAPLTISGATVTSRAYNGGTDATVTAVTLEGLQNGETLTLGTDFTATGAFTSKNAGTTTADVTVSLKDTEKANNYSIGTTPFVASSSITKKAVSLAVSGIPAFTYDRSTVSSSVEISTGTGSEKLTAVCTAYSYKAGTYTYAASAGVGKYTVAWSDGTGLVSNYDVTTSSGTDLVINQKNLTVIGTTVAASRAYDGKTDVKSCVSKIGSLDGVVSGDTVSIKNDWTADVTEAKVGAGKTITFVIHLDGADAANYSVTSPSKTIEITKAPLTISGATVTSKAYNGNTNGKVTAVTFTGLQNGETLTLGTDFTAAGAFTSKNAGTTTVNVTVSLKDTEKANNYSIGTTPFVASSSITKKAVTLNLPDQSIEYDNSTDHVDAYIKTGVGSETLKVTYTANSVNVDTYTYSETSGAHLYTVTKDNGSGDLSNYTVTFGTKGTFKILPKEIEIKTAGTYTTPRAYNGLKDVTANVTLGELTGYISTDADKVSIKSGWTAAMTDKHVGTDKAITFTDLELTGAAAGNYTLKTPTLTITITQLGIKVSSAVVVDRPYDGTTSGEVSSVTFDTDLANSELALTTDYTVSVVFGDKNASDSASSTVTVTLSDTTAANNFVLTTASCAETSKITKANVTVTLPAASRAYDGTVTIQKDVDTTVNGENLKFTYMAYSANQGTYVYSATAAAGNYTASYANGTGDVNNYVVTVGPSPGNFVITKKELTVTVATTTARDYNGETDITDQVALSGLTGIVNSEDVTIASGWTAYMTNANAGTGKAVKFTGLVLDGTAKGNYKLKTPSLTITINKLSISVSSAVVAEKNYNGNTTGTVSSVTFDNVLANSDLTIVTDYSAAAVYAYAKADDNAASTVTVTLGTTTAAKNFTLSTATCPATSKIAKAPVTLTLPSASKTYNNDATIEKTVNTGVNSENLKVTYTAYSVNQGTYAYSATAAAGKYTIAWSNGTGDVANYDITVGSSPGSFTINKKELTLPDASVTARDYDGTKNVKSNVLLGALSGIVSGDGSSVTVKSDWTATIASANAGSGKTVTITATLEGTGSGNYSLKVPTALKITINKLSISVSSAVVAEKNYNGNTTGTVSSVTFDKALANSDLTIDIDYSAAAVYAYAKADDNAASTVTVTLGTTTAAKNFTLSTATCPATSKIAKAPVTLTLPSASKTYNNDATIENTVNTGVNSENLKVTYTAYSVNQGTYAYSATAAAGKYTIAWSNGTGDVANYDITVGSSPGSFVINKATLTLPSASASPRIYNGSADVTAQITLGALNGLATGDTSSMVYVSSAWTAAMDDANAGSNKTITFTGLTLAGSKAGNYKLTAPVLKITINKAASTLDSAPVAINPTYTGSLLDLVTAGTCTGGSMMYKLDSGVYSDSIPQAKNASDSYTVYYYVKGDGNHEDTGEYSLTATIQKAQSAITDPPAANTLTYSGSALVLVTTGTCTGGTMMYKLSTEADYSATRPSATDAKTYSVLYYVKGDSNHLDSDTGSVAVTIKKADIEVLVYPTAKTVTYNSEQQDLMKAGTCVGGTFEYADAAQPYSTTVPTAESAGKYYVYYKAIGDANHNDIAEVTLVAYIKQKVLTLPYAQSFARDYNGQTDVTNNIILGSLAGKVYGDDVKISSSVWTAAVESKDAGENKPIVFTNLTLSGADSANYILDTSSIKITINPLKIIIDDLGSKKKIYNADRYYTTYSVNNKMSGDRITVEALFDDKNVGTDKVISFTVTGLDAGNYIKPDDLTGAKITALDTYIIGLVAKDKTYDGTKAAEIIGTAVVSALIEGDVVNVVTGSATFNDKNVGTGKTVTFSGYSLDGTDASNYNLVEQPAQVTADITKLYTVITGLGVSDKAYDGTKDATVKGTAVIVGKIPTDGVSVVSGTATFADRNVGTKVAIFSGYSLTGTDADNYNLIAQPASVYANILPRATTVSGFTSEGKVYDGTTVAKIVGVGVIDNLISGDDVSIVKGTAVFNNKNVGTGKTVTFDGFCLTGMNSGNYTLSAQPTCSVTYEITKATLTVGGIAVNDKVYDGKATGTFSSTGVLVGIIGTDVVTLKSTMAAAFSDKNVGNDKTVTLSGYAIEGTDAGNYSLTAPSPVTASISKLDVTITGMTVNDKVYDGTRTATYTGTPVVSGMIAGDKVDVLPGIIEPVVFVDKNAGTNKVVNFNGFSLAGSDAGNYRLVAQPTGVATILLKPVTITGVKSADKVYDGSDSAYTSGSPAINGKVSGDSLKIGHGIAKFDTKFVGNGKTVNFSGFTLNGSDAANYELTAQPAPVTNNITPKELSVSGILVKDKVYDGTTVATFANTGVLVGVIGSDAVSLVSGMTATFDDKNVGSGKTVTLSGYSLTGSGAGNYSLTAPSSVTASISKLDVYITGIDSNNKGYDGLSTADVIGTPGISAVSGSMTTGDDLSVVSGKAYFSDKNVGNAKTVYFVDFELAGADKDNYNLVGQPAHVTKNITKKDVTVAAGSVEPTKTYDGTTYWEPTGEYYVFTGVIDADKPYVKLVGKFNFDVATTAATKVVATELLLAGNECHNYNLTTTTYDIAGASITKKSVDTADVVWIDLDSGAYVYNAKNQGSTIRAYFVGINGQVDLLISFKGKTGAATDTTVFRNAGEYEVSAFNTDENYQIGTDDYVKKDYTIAQKQLSIVWGSTSFVYDASCHLPEISCIGLIDLDNISLNVPIAQQQKVAGNYTATAVFTDTGANIANYSYDESLLTRDWKILQKDLLIVGKPINVEYDGKEYKATVNILTAVGLVKDSHKLSSAVFTGTYAGTGVTSGTFSLSSVTVKEGVFNVTSNYSITTDGPWNFTISQRPLYADAGTVLPEKVYDGTTAWTPVAGSYVLKNLVNNDDVQLTAAYDFNSKNVLSANYVKATGLGLIGDKAGNYKLVTDSFIIVGASIAPKHVSVNATLSYVPTKVYDGVSAWTPTLDCYQFDGVAVGDDVTLVASYTYTDSNVLTANKKVVVTDLSLAGGDASNYILDTASFEYGSAEITVRTLKVTPASGQSKQFGQPDPVLVCAYSNNVDGEIPGFTGALVRDAGESTGKYMIHQGDIDIADNGAFIASNYVMEFTGGVYFEIKSQDLTKGHFTVDTSDEVYDGTPKYKSVESDLILGQDYTVEFLNNTNAGKATILITGYGEYTGTVEYNFIIQKMGIETPEPKYYLYTGDGVYFDIPTSKYYVEDSGNPYYGVEPNTYSFHFTLKDKNNMKWADEKFDGNYKVYITIRELSHANADGVVDVYLLSEVGFRFDLTLNVVHNDNPVKLQEEYDIQGGTAVYAYGITLYDKEGNEVQPYGAVTVKVLVPNNCTGGSFDIYHIHNGVAEKVDKHYETINGHKYAVFTVSEFSDFLFVKQSTNYTLALLAIILIIDAIIAMVVLSRKEKNGKVL